MNKADLVNAMAAESGLTKADASKALNAFIAAVTAALKEGDKVALVGFAHSASANVPHAKGVNPLKRTIHRNPGQESSALQAGNRTGPLTTQRTRARKRRVPTKPRARSTHAGDTTPIGPHRRAAPCLRARADIGACSAQPLPPAACPSLLPLQTTIGMPPCGHTRATVPTHLRHRAGTGAPGLRHTPMPSRPGTPVPASHQGRQAAGWRHPDAFCPGGNRKSQIFP